MTMRYNGKRHTRTRDYAYRVVIEGSLDFDSPTGGTYYSYDASGRLIQGSGSGIYSIKYAPNDMPVAVLNQATSIAYRYRSDGVKLSASVIPSAEEGLLSLTRTRYYAGPWRFVRENGGSLKAERINLPWGYLDKNSAPNVYLKDHQGNVRAVVNQYSGEIVQQTDYYPYGLPVSCDEDILNSYLYGEKEFDQRQGLNVYDFIARTYAPDEARFCLLLHLATDIFEEKSL